MGQMNDWNIQTRGNACEACGKPFADKQPYHTLLFEQGSGFRRRDVCEPCWQKESETAVRGREGFVSHWRGVYQAPPPPNEPIHKQTAESLLRKLIGLNDPAYIPAGYILAVMLERKRLLKVKEQIVRDGRRVFIYEHPGSGDLFTIVDPELKLDQLEQVQRDVARLLEEGLNQPAQPAPTGSAAAAATEAGNAGEAVTAATAEPAGLAATSGFAEPNN